MPFGQSVFIAAPASALAGFFGGELTELVVKKMGGGVFEQKLFKTIGHGVSSAAAGYAVNIIFGGDVTGAVVTTGQTAVTAIAHGGLLANAHHSIFDVFLHT